MKNQGIATLTGVFDRLSDKRLDIKTFISLGAGSGDDHVFFRQYWPDMEILFVEMDDQYKQRFEHHQQSSTGIQYTICAAGAFDGDGAFSKTSKVGGSLVPTDRAGGATSPTKVAKVDSLASEFNLEPPFFLKFDTHGAEQDILGGSEEVLSNTALILMEVYNFPLAFSGGRSLMFGDMSVLLQNLGFRCIDICDPLYRPGDQALWQFHMAFVRSDNPLFSYGGFSSGLESKADHFS